MIGHNTTIRTFRISVDEAGKEQYSSTPTINRLLAYIEPAEDQPSEFVNGEVPFNAYRCFVDGKPDMKISDKIVDSDDGQYTVKGIQFFKGGDVPDHTEILAIKKRDDYI